MASENHEKKRKLSNLGGAQVAHDGAALPPPPQPARAMTTPTAASTATAMTPTATPPPPVITAESLLQRTRQLLIEKKVDKAREGFHQLPELATSAKKYLHAIIHQFYLAGMYDVLVVLKFLKKLPYEWMLDGCLILHEADESIRQSIVTISHFATFPLAFFIHDLLQHARSPEYHREGAVEMDYTLYQRAEKYWTEWFCPTIRAIVMGKQVVMESHMYRETFFVPASEWAFDDNRKNVFCWSGEWTPDGDKEKWLFVPINDRKDRFYLKSVAYDEYLYASNYAKYRAEDGTYQSRVFTWSPEDEEEEDDDDTENEEKGRDRDDKTPGISGEWQLVPADNDNRDVFALYNHYQGEYLFPSKDFHDEEEENEDTRRLVRTASHRSDDPTWMEERKWRILPVDTSMQVAAMDLGIEAFLMKQYPVAIKYFSRALEELPDHTKYVKCFIFRMISNLRCRNFDDVRADFEALGVLGGQHAAEFHGLGDMWAECAAFLEDRIGPLYLQQYLSTADNCLANKQYDKAAGLYSLAASAVKTLDPIETKAKRAWAHLSASKCLVTLNRFDEATQNLKQALAVVATIKQTQQAEDIVVTSVEQKDLVELEGQLILWSAKCHRKQKRFNEAVVALEQALDSSSYALLSTFMKESLSSEMKLTLLMRDANGMVVNPQAVPGSDRVTSILARWQKLMELCQCPLSMDVMQDPVVTPSGTTYERAMIEKHLEVNGNFDPLTRGPLTKAMLVPNRTLKKLVEQLHQDGEYQQAPSTQKATL